YPAITHAQDLRNKVTDYPHEQTANGRRKHVGDGQTFEQMAHGGKSFHVQRADERATNAEHEVQRQFEWMLEFDGRHGEHRAPSADGAAINRIRNDRSYKRWHQRGGLKFHVAIENFSGIKRSTKRCAKYRSDARACA